MDRIRATSCQLLHRFHSVDVSLEENPSLNTTLFSYFLLSRSLGNILSTPISSGLLTGSTVDMTKVFPLSGGKYENVIIFVGTCFAGAAGISLFGWSLELRQRARSSGGD